MKIKAGDVLKWILMIALAIADIVIIQAAGPAEEGEWGKLIL